MTFSDVGAGVKLKRQWLGALVLIFLATSALAATDPSTNGPYTAGLVTQDVPLPSGARSTDIHFPDDGTGGIDPAAIPCPVILFGHGFSRTKAQYVNLGAHWASRGYVVLMPNFAGADHSQNADDLSGLVTWILAQDQDPASPFFGRIARDAIGCSGHSAGGLSSILCAARDSRIGACAPLDPVDNNSMGVTEAPNIRCPSAMTWSEPSSCNSNGSAIALYAASPAPKRGVKIVGGTHCDPEDPTNLLCTLVCGHASAARQALYRKNVTGWFEYWLRCDASYEPWLQGTIAQADVASGVTTFDSVPAPLPLPCVGSPPPEVTGLRVARSGTVVNLSWDPVVATPSVLEYRVLRDVLPRLPAAVEAGRSSVRAFDDPPIIGDGLLWFYEVRAINAAGEGP